MSKQSERWLGRRIVVPGICAFVLCTASGAITFAADGDGDKLTAQIEHNVGMAEDLLSQGRYSDAEGLYREALVNNPQDVRASAGLGMALAKQFKLDGADDLFNRVLSTDPNNVRAHAGRATIMLNRLASSSGTIIANRDSMLKQAESEAQIATRLGPASAEAHYTLGLVLKEQGRLDDAGGEFRTATSLDPNYSHAYAGLGMIKLNQGSLAEATEQFKRAININSNNSTAHFGLGTALFKQGLTDDAIKELNIALYQFPNSAPVHMTLGDAYAKQGNTAAALKEYQVAITIKPEVAEPYLKIADIREQRGDTELALAELRSGLAQMPYDLDLRLRIAQNCLKLEKADDAIRNYKTILGMSPGNATAVKGLTQALYLKAQKAAVGALLASNDYDLALKTLDEAIKLSPDDLELRLAQAKLMAMAGAKPDLSKVGQPQSDGDRLAYAEALMAQGEFQKAQEQLGMVVAKVSDAKQAFAVADLAVMIKDLDSAEAAYKKGWTFDGGADRAQRGLAEVTRLRQAALDDIKVAGELLKKKQMDGAMERYRKSIATNPKVADARLGLAQSLEKMQKPSGQNLKEAATQYRTYILLSPDLPNKDKDKILNTADKLDDKAAKMIQKSKNG